MCVLHMSALYVCMFHACVSEFVFDCQCPRVERYSFVCMCTCAYATFSFSHVTVEISPYFSYASLDSDSYDGLALVDVVALV